MKDDGEVKGSLMARALWQIETDLAGQVDLGSLAAALGVSRFHLNRAFSVRFGRSTMAYVRARRLSLAASALERQGLSITEIALDAGYETLEGFIRAFKAQFGVAPGQFRAEPTKYSHRKQEPLPMPDSSESSLSPRIIEFEGLALVGLNRSYRFEERGGIPGQFREFMSGHSHLTVGKETFGVCHSFGDGAFEFLTGAHAQDGAEGLTGLNIPAGLHAVFDVAGDVTDIAPTWDAIMSDWLPNSEYEITDGPEFEYYEAGYDPSTPGGVSIYIPVRKPA